MQLVGNLCRQLVIHFTMSSLLLPTLPCCAALQTMMLGQEPRQTTSNLGALNKPSIQVCLGAQGGG